MDSIAGAQNPALTVKFNKLVYDDEKLTPDEKFYLLGELQKRCQRIAHKQDKKDRQDDSPE